MSNNLSLVAKYMLRSKKEFFLAVFLMFVSTCFVIAIPLVAKTVINAIINKTLSLSGLFFWFFIAVVCAVLGSLIEGLGRYFTSSVGTKSQYYIRKDIYESINRQGFRFFDSTESGDLVSRVTSDIENSNLIFTRSANQFITSILSFIGVTIGCYLTVKISVLAVLMGVLIYIAVIFFCYNKISAAFLKSRNNFGHLTTIIKENLVGAAVVRIFSAENKELKKFNNKNNAFRTDTIETIKYQTIITNSGLIILNLLIVFSLVFGGLLVLNQSIDIGTLLAFVSYMSMLGMSLGNFGHVVIDFVQAGASLKRVNEIIETTTEIVEKPNPVSKFIEGDVEFKNVSFGYVSNSLVLKNLNFKIKKGERVAIVGTTGSGKTSLINLIPRYYDVDKGAVYIDNVNVKDYKISNLRSQIGFCSQEVFLFNISIADNIRFGRPNATMEEVIDAGKHANIHDFIMTLPKGYDTIVGERGSSLSGGQKQRVAIARALILQPKILILDDSTSAVDTETEYKIQTALDYLMKNRTSFIITQRVGNLKKANKILVMDKGYIIGLGIHEELYNKNIMYTNIYDTLFKKQKEAELELKKGGNL
ncbi:putative ABC transporter ATP-binding protein [Candidatus Tiddalikarchaeum anstoanum]|nr:putative ABC transporter ATP-binding protein [Candidatus Tiddalikarchaeum anstoanum]